MFCISVSTGNRVLVPERWKSWITCEPSQWFRKATYSSGAAGKLLTSVCYTDKWFYCFNVNIFVWLSHVLYRHLGYIYEFLIYINECIICCAQLYNSLIYLWYIWVITGCWNENNKCCRDWLWKCFCPASFFRRWVVNGLHHTQKHFLFTFIYIHTCVSEVPSNFNHVKFLLSIAPSSGHWYPVKNW